MDTVQRRSRLLGWLETIRADVKDLLLDQHVFWELQAIIDANPNLAEHPGLFSQWMASSFGQATAVGIRRQAKPQADSISTKRFLQEVHDHPSLVSRDFYLSFFADAHDELRRIADNHFDSVAGQGRQELPPAVVDDQIRNLEVAVAGIEHYVDRRLAHYDQRGVTKPTPRFGDLKHALQVLEELVQFYWPLLKGGSIVDGLLGPIPDDWQNVFTIAWIDRRNPVTRRKAASNHV